MNKYLISNSSNIVCDTQTDGNTTFNKLNITLNIFLKKEKE